MSSQAALRKKEEEEAIKKSIEVAYKTCTTPTVFNYSRPLSGTSMRLHTILMIVCGCMGIVSVLLAAYLLAGHLRYYTSPKEQKPHLRIIMFIPFLTVTSFLALTFPNSSGWITPIGSFYELLAISALFAFYCQIILEKDGKTDKLTLSNVQRAIATENARDPKAKKSIGWVRRCWFMVYQIVVTRTITLIANEILYALTCPLSKSREYGGTAIIAVQSVTTWVAVLGVIGFERRTHKTFLRPIHPLLKLVSFKAVIALQSIQEIIFEALTATKTFFPSPPFYISYNDFSKVFPQAIFLFEMMIVAIIFQWSFSFKKYRSEFQLGKSRAQNPVLALLSAFLPLDVYMAFFSGFKSFHYKGTENGSAFMSGYKSSDGHGIENEGEM